MKNEQSKAYELVRIVWDHANSTRSHSWTRYNHALHEAVSLAISAGIPFHKDDFQTFRSDMRGGYWFGESGIMSWYTLACSMGNLTAAISIEQYLGMAPFRVGDKRLCVRSGRRDQDLREYTGREADRGFYVTSMAPDHLVACRYTDETGVWRSKPTKRRKIDRDEIAAVNREIAEAAKLLPVKRTGVAGSVEAKIVQKIGRDLRLVAVKKTNIKKASGKLHVIDVGEQVFFVRKEYGCGGGFWDECTTEIARRLGAEDKHVAKVKT